MDLTGPAETLAALERFYRTSLDERLAALRTSGGEAEALTHFHRAAADIPAYRKFLAERSIDPASISTLEEFRQVPATTKESYIQRYPLAELCRGGLDRCDMVAVSSGSTGTPTFWLRSAEDELEVAYRFEQVFRDAFRADERSTLAVVCFALGTWVGGMYTAACCRHLSAKGCRVTVVTPGSNRAEILRVVTALAPEYDQTVLLGYPPFLKDVVDEGIGQGVDWGRFRIKLVMAGEVFSEEWRTLMARRIGSGDPRQDFASLYGTADGGVLGCETPLSIAIRRWLAEQPEAARSLFGEPRLPTLVQYDPASRFFEVQDGRLLITGDSGIPLVRYNILDTGGVITFKEMLQFARERGFDPLAALADSDARPPHELPFVYVFGRTSFAVSFYGANVYPENVSPALEQPHVCEWVTGKFVLQAVEDEDRNRHLEIAVELAAGQAPDGGRCSALQDSILAQLLRLNSEFAHYVPADRQIPRVTLHPAGSPEYFPPGVKHRYTR